MPIPDGLLDDDIRTAMDLFGYDISGIKIEKDSNKTIIYRALK